MLYIVLGIIGVVSFAAWYCFFGPHTTFTTDDLAEQLAPGHKKRMALYHRARGRKGRTKIRSAQNGRTKGRALNKNFKPPSGYSITSAGSQTLENQIAEESRRTTTAGRSSERLLKLNQHLAQLRSNLSD